MEPRLSMKKVFLIANDADACGNSTLATLLNSYLERKSMRTRLVLTSIEQELPAATDLIEIEDGFRAEDVVNLIDKADAVIFDVHTGGAEKFEEQFDRNELATVMDEIETQPVVVLPVCDDAQVIRGATDALQAYRHCADFVIVRMPLPADKPMKWETCDTRRTLLGMGAMEIEMPAVREEVLDELDAMELDVPLALAQRNQLPRFLRHELLMWEVAFGERLREAEEAILPVKQGAEDMREDSIFGKTLSL